MADPESPKAVVLEFYRLALEQFRPKDAFERYATTDFVEHSPEIAGGTREAASAFLEDLIRKFLAPKWEVIRSAAEAPSSSSTYT
jgi:predicted SnoaL-like aldol condensation-catalyzing enzyme